MDFVELPGFQQGPPPYLFHGVTVNCFPMPASLERIGAYCDNYLSGFAPEWRFSPIAPIAYLFVNSYPDIQSGEAPGVTSMRQHEYGFMVPVIRWHTSWFNLMTPRLTWIFPYIGVDNGTSALTGQEVLGFQKMVGDITIEADTSSLSATVAMPCFRELRRVDRIRTILTLEAAVTEADDVAPVSPAHHPVQGHLRGRLDEMDALAEAWLELANPGMLTVTNLRQFRDPVAWRRASYAALVEARWHCSDFQDARLYAAPTVRILDEMWLRIADTLGLEQTAGPDSNGFRQFAAGEGFGFTADMHFGDARTLVQVD